MNNLARLSHSQAICAGGIRACLKAIGCDPVEVDRGGKSFWFVNHGHLDWFWLDARRAYLRAIRRCHPDRAGGDLKAAQALNAVWSRIEHLFLAHGVPSLPAPVFTTRATRLDVRWALVQAEYCDRLRKLICLRECAERLSLAQAIIDAGGALTEAARSLGLSKAQLVANMHRENVPTPAQFGFKK
jgi:hypothetical protein